MEIRFKHFRFITEQSVLYEDKEIVHLKPNQLALLELFLSRPDSILSKDDILNHVWSNKIVSEQVVFQTMSQLRVLLGEDAIKTYPKKGYKWQYPLTSGSDNPKNSTLINAPSELKITPAATPGLKWLFIASAILIILAITYSVILPKDSTNSLPEQINLVHHAGSEIAGASQFTQHFSEAIAEQSAITRITLADSPQQIFASPKLYWRQNQPEANTWLAWGDVFSSERGSFMHYGLVRQNITWEGYVFAQKPGQLAAALRAELHQLAELGLFSQSTERLDSAFLTQMARKAPHNHEVQLRQADLDIASNQFDVALTRLSKVRNSATDYNEIPYQARAHWLMGKVFKMRDQYDQAFNSLQQMTAILETTPLWPLSFKNIHTNALLAFEERQYEKMNRILERGLNLARQQADPFTLFELHIMYSMLAEKTHNHLQMHAQLNEAQALLMKHQLGEANRAIVYFYFAKFTDDKTASIAFLQEVLSLPRSAQNYWLQDEALNLLVNHYIAEQQFSEAETLLATRLDSANILQLKARILLRQQRENEAYELLAKAFDQARLEYNRYIGLEAALLLYQLSENNPVLQAEYKAYLLSNGQKGWLQKHNILTADATLTL